MKTNTLPVERSASGLREALFEAIDGLRAGTLDVKAANAIAKSADTIIRSIDTQIEFEKLRLDSKVPAALPAMHLAPKLTNDKAK